MSRFQMLSDAQWELIAPMLPTRTGRAGRPFADARTMVEAIIYRYRCGIAWRDLPEVYGPWQTALTWCWRMAAEGTWHEVLATLAAASDAQGLIYGSVRTGLRDRPRSSASHGHCPPCRGWIELRESAG